MLGLIKNIIEDIFALFFYGGILLFGASEIFLMLRKEVYRKVQEGGPSLSKISQGLTCQKFDENMNLVKITSGHCGKKIKRNR